MNNLCTICMRKGSKGVPNKNLREINGKPLMAYTIEKAIQSELFLHVVVSTDSEQIAETAKNFGADVWFLRPKELALDDTPKLPVIRHAFQESEKYYGQMFDILMDLDSTSPLREVEDITGSYRQFVKEDADNLISVCCAKKNPYYNMVELVNGKVQLIKKTHPVPHSRQSAPQVFDMNASIYIWKRETLLKYNSLFLEKTSLYVMNEDRSVDIDSQHDFNLVDYMIKKQKKIHD
jgi:CMP-N,N'-diacetyllegionaminic acid synthase